MGCTKVETFSNVKGAEFAVNGDAERADGFIYLICIYG